MLYACKRCGESTACLGRVCHWCQYGIARPPAATLVLNHLHGVRADVTEVRRSWERRDEADPFAKEVSIAFEDR